MGSAISCGKDNNDLINILMLLGYIRSKEVERVFRAVDRGDYVLPSHRDVAYKDLSWKVGNIHLSAPCIYCKVMEGLTLKPGLSFLNIGSGTGYLSTMAGLILGKNGTNHGIEIHEDCLTYAYEHLEAFNQKSLDVDCFEFCEPVFKLGNILNATPDRQYDRVYCGAACPEIHEQYIQQFVKVGGILVMPYLDNLLKIERLDEDTWRSRPMLPVSFASLVTPPEEKERGFLQLPLWQPCTLQELCRSSVRRHLRKLVWSEHSDLESRAPIIAQPIDRTIPQLHFGIPFFQELNRAHQREVVASALQHVREVIQPYEGSENRDDDQHDARTSDDSEEVDNSERGREAEPVDTTKETENLETEMQEDFFELANHGPLEPADYMDLENISKEESSMEAKGAQDAEIEDCDSDEMEAFSLLKDKFETETQQNSSSTSHISGTSSEDPGSNDPLEASDNRENAESESEEEDESLFVRLLAAKMEEEGEESASSNRESRENGSNAFPSDGISSKDGNSRKSVDFEPVEDDDEDTKMPEKTEGSLDTSSDEEENERTKYRRSLRFGRKRRSEQRSDSSESNDSSNVVYASDCSDSTAADSDFDFNFIYQRNPQRNTYAHTLRKEEISHFMQKKVASLPLPLPLRLYVNYNREL